MKLSNCLPIISAMVAMVIVIIRPGRQRETGYATTKTKIWESWQLGN